MDERALIMRCIKSYQVLMDEAFQRHAESRRSSMSSSVPKKVFLMQIHATWLPRLETVTPEMT